MPSTFPCDAAVANCAALFARIVLTSVDCCAAAETAINAIRTIVILFIFSLPSCSRIVEHRLQPVGSRGKTGSSRCSMDSRSVRVDVDDTFDRPPADFAEADFVAREHDAVGLRTEKSLRFVARAFERADLAGVLFIDVEELRFPRLLFAEERVHLRLRTILRAQLAPPRLNVARVFLELFFVPRRRQRHAGIDELGPLRMRAVRSDVRLPRLGMRTAGLVRDVARDR